MVVEKIVNVRMGLKRFHVLPVEETATSFPLSSGGIHLPNMELIAGNDTPYKLSNRVYTFSQRESTCQTWSSLLEMTLPTS